MTTVFAQGGNAEVITEDVKREAVRAALRLAGDASRLLVLPPDGTRPHSDAGLLTNMLFEEWGSGETFHVMPALGTHLAMDRDELVRMFGPAIPGRSFIAHNWRRDIARLGQVPSEYVHGVSEGMLRDHVPHYDIPVEINERLLSGAYGAIVSVGQVVPHEVAGMANGFKNVLIGTGGADTINRSHFLGAVFGMERIMGRAETPVRAVLNYAHEHHLAPLGIVYVLTVMARAASGETVMRGIYVGDDHQTFLLAARLSRQVNVMLLKRPQDRMVAYLDPAEFKSTWLGNKAIYRTRMALADDGELLVLAPGVKMFGEDPEIDRLIRRYGYGGTPATLEAVRRNAELRNNLSAAAHLIHGSSEGRFRIVYATDPELLSRDEVENAGFQWRHVADALAQYDPERLPDGPNEGFYFVGRPALGLWAVEEKFTG